MHARGLRRGLQCIRTTPHQHHPPTFGQQSQRACFANARTRACDDCYFAHVCVPLKNTIVNEPTFGDSSPLC
jgi:hypothetical protein